MAELRNKEVVLCGCHGRIAERFPFDEIRQFLQKMSPDVQVVVADDLCTGLRSMGTVSESEGDPLEDPIGRLINMHKSRVPCPSRARAEDRLTDLLDIIKRSGALGVLFLHQKFCSPHLSDFPYLSSQLRENNIKSIQIEMDETWKASGQLKTRMEGFFEMVRG